MQYDELYEPSLRHIVAKNSSKKLTSAPHQSAIRFQHSRPDDETLQYARTHNVCWWVSCDFLLHYHDNSFLVKSHSEKNNAKMLCWSFTTVHRFFLFLFLFFFLSVLVDYGSIDLSGHIDLVALYILMTVLYQCVHGKPDTCKTNSVKYQKLHHLCTIMPHPPRTRYAHDHHGYRLHLLELHRCLIRITRRKTVTYG